MKIVYYLITHKNEPQIRRLAAHLLASENSYVLIHHSATSEPLQLKSCKNMHIISDPVEVGWGDITFIHAMNKGLDWLKTEKVQFDWLITLSGQDYPIKPLSEIETELKNSKFDGYVNHEVIHEDYALHKRYFHKTSYHKYFFKRIYFPVIGRVKFKRRHPYVNGFKCYAGSAWMNLSMRAVESLWSRRDLTDRMIKYLYNSSIPDETLFQTVLGNDSSLNLCDSNKRFIVWKGRKPNPEILDLEYLDAILESDAWFARKVEDDVSSDLLTRLDEVIYSDV